VAEAADMTTPDEAAWASAMAAAMASENRRREVASASPGYGALVHLEQPPSGAGVGISDVGMPIIGEGYAIQAEIAAAVHKAYGETRPQYADPVVGGPGYGDGIHQPASRHVTDLGADGLFIEGASAPAADPYLVVSPPPRPGLLSRLRGLLRRGQ
jgi:hypothetical protein